MSGLMSWEDFQERYVPFLNEQQRRAVRAGEGYVLLLAVPGSGKTTVLVARLGFLLLCRGIPVEELLTMTYTVSAARDMRWRFRELFGAEAPGELEFRTINGVAARIIRRYEQRLGRRAFALAEDERELAALVGELGRKVTGSYLAESDIKALRTAITYAKNSCCGEERLEELEKGLRGFRAVYEEYDRVLRRRGQMDYDDQLIYAYRILCAYPEILEELQEQYRYFCVDEAQDTSFIQHQILELLARRSGNLFLVGDEDQSIYGFRAACPAYLMEFEGRHPGAEILLMEQNYRSAAPIVAAADRFIRSNRGRRDKHMRPARTGGAAVTARWVFDRKEQYEVLLPLARGVPENTAVLYRDNDSALPLIDRLEREGLPYRCRQMDGSFFSHRIVRDIAGIIRLARRPDDRELFLELYYKFSAGISRAAAEGAAAAGRPGEPLLAVAAAQPGVSEFTRRQCRGLLTHMAHLLEERGDKAVYRIVHFMGYGDFLESRGLDGGKAAILEALGSRESGPERLLERLEELEELLRRRPGGGEEGLILSTIHSSKGLEYDRVFLLDVVDGVLPRGQEGEELEEERRLFYVGMTRAREELTVFRFRAGGLASSFSAALFAPARQPGRGVRAPALCPAAAAARGEDFFPGARVRHRSMGEGVVTARQGDVLTIDFPEGSRRVMLSAALRVGVLKRL